jgi:hypothetical protein
VCSHRRRRNDAEDADDEGCDRARHARSPESRRER